MIGSSRAGISLVELLVSLVLLELLAVTTLHTVLATQRIARDVASGTAIDIARLTAVRTAAADPFCLAAPTPTLVPLTLGGSATRPPATVLIRCGR
jgi:Tfp pilus assembly protein FimT